MKTLIIAVLLATSAIAFAGPTQSPKSTVEVSATYDKKKEVTTLHLGELMLWKQPAMQQLVLAVTFDSPKRVIAKPKEVVLTFRALSNEGLLFPTTTLSVLADDQRLDFGKMKGDWKGPSGGLMIEQLKMAIPYEAFSQIASAKKVIMIVSDRNYEISADQLQALRSFHQVMQREGQQVG